MNKEQVIVLLLKTDQANDFAWTKAKLMKRDLSTLLKRLDRINKAEEKEG